MSFHSVVLSWIDDYLQRARCVFRSTAPSSCTFRVSNDIPNELSVGQGGGESFQNECMSLSSLINSSSLGSLGQCSVYTGRTEHSRNGPTTPEIPPYRCDMMEAFCFHGNVIQQHSGMFPLCGNGWWWWWRQWQWLTGFSGKNWIKLTCVTFWRCVSHLQLRCVRATTPPVHSSWSLKITAIRLSLLRFI